MRNLWIYLRPRAKISRKESNRLKDQIRKRLQHEDYTCRLSNLSINVELKHRAREIAHRHCICSDSAFDPKVMINHSNLCDEITAAVLEAWNLCDKVHDTQRALRI